jgi:hypothetical protein
MKYLTCFLQQSLWELQKKNPYKFMAVFGGGALRIVTLMVSQ